jgi:anti-repressor protein
MGIIKKFHHHLFGDIRTMMNEKGETFFVGKDVAQALGYAKPENALSAHVDSDDKTTTLIQGTGSNYKSKAVIINESGLYALVLSSKLPQARQFKRWVTNEVLPQIRKTGGKHAFSFTPKADTVAQKWRSAMSDFSIMLRKSYDGSFQ